MHIGREFKKDLELDSLEVYSNNLRPNRSWLDLLSLSLLFNLNTYKFDFTNLTDNLSEDAAIIVDSHGNIFKDYQICFWRKDRISDILPAIKCPSFKSETKTFKTSEMKKMRKFINDQNHTKSIVIEKTDEELSINLIYGNTIKITPWTFCSFQQTNFFEKLHERYELWLIENCACKPKKIRVCADDFENFKYTIEELERISNINDAKLGMTMFSENYNKLFSKYDTMIFNNSTRWMSVKDTNFVFSGDSLTVVYKGNYYNFRFDQRTKESEYSQVSGRI